MDNLALILWSASFLWAYAFVLTIAWVRAVGRERLETHVGHWVSLMALLVPPAAICILIVLIAGVLRQGWLAPLLIVALPGGLVVSLQLELSRLSDASPRTEYARLVAALLLTLIFSART